MRVSVVVCTLNRADALDATLRCLRHQNHDDFEVIVVNGPSTDHTLEVLAPWRESVHYYDNPERNLSISRNIGIRAASGDLVAFIDDDALPEAEWLNQAIPAFDDPEVSSAGGIVFDHTGMGLQYRYTATNRLLRATPSQREFVNQCFPGTFQFPYLQGTNQIHRRDRLIEIGGFDERIYFYGDDCDICARMIDAGWVVKQLPTSPVHHKYLPSGIRDHQRITTNWFPVVHDHTYFCMRHASSFMSEDEVIHHIHGFIHTRIADTQLHQDAGRLPDGSSVYAEATCLKAFAAGYADGQEWRDRRLPPLAPDPAGFLRFATVRAHDRRRMVFVSSSYTGNLTGGVGRLFSELAPAMAARGHDVRVVTRAAHGAPAVDFEDGVWVHRIEVPELAPGTGVAPDVLAPLNNFATAAASEVRRVRDWTSPDLVFVPMWDLEGIGVLRETDLPVAVHVSTPLAIIGPMAGFMRNDGSDPPELQRVLDLEAEVFATSDLFQANTAAVEATVQSSYGDDCRADRWEIVNIGVRDRLADTGERSTNRDPERRRVFFVGRFEARKGIDTLLAAMQRILPDYPDLDLVLAGEDRALGPGLAPVGQDWLDHNRIEPWIAQVEMLGVVDDDELHDQYAAADVVALPSRYESFGLVMAEAMMHGKPLVTTNSSGVREVVRHGLDGLLVEPGDDVQLERAIRKLLDDTDAAAEMGRTARRRFSEWLAMDRVAERFEQWFCRVRPAGEEHQVVTGELPTDRAVEVKLDAGAATAVVRAAFAGALMVDDGTLRRLVLEAGERRRIRLDVATGEAKLSATVPGIVLESVVLVDDAVGPA